MAGSIGALSMLILSSGIVYWGYQELNDAQMKTITSYEDKVKEAEKLLIEQQIAKQKVYVLNQDIGAGTVISADQISMVELTKEIIPQNIVTKQDAVGKVAKIDIKRNTSLIQSMLFENGNVPQDLRNNEFKMIALPSKLKVGDYTDIRIKFPTGHDYIVLTKKKVKDLIGGILWVEMDEEEILTMSSALVDAYLEQATIYALSYVDPYMQEEAIVTYPVSSRVLDLIKADPNIVHVARTVLEKRHREILEKDLKEMGETDKLTYISKQSSDVVRNPRDSSLIAPTSDSNASNVEAIISGESRSNEVHTPSIEGVPNNISDVEEQSRIFDSNSAQ